MSTAADLQFCDDFSTAIYAPSVILKAADDAAAAQGFKVYGREFSRFSQGYCHAVQGRTDILGQCPVYDAGFKAYVAN